MHRLRIASLALAPVLIAATIVLASPSTAPAAVCSAKGTQPPQVGTGDDLIFGVDGTTACDLWIVGNFDSGGPEQTLIYRLTPNGWKHQESPNRAGSDYLNGVSAVSSSLAWTVGSSVNGTDPNRTLIERWNGKRWRIQPSPNVGTGLNILFAVDGTSPNDAWAVGERQGTTGNQVLILRWNGTTWKSLPPPVRSLTSFGAELTAVNAISATNAWAVGELDNQTLILHWNGKTWHRQPSPNPGSGENQLFGVAAVSAKDAWAVGADSDGSHYRSLVMHWNGKRWRLQPSPSPSTAPNSDELDGVAATSSGAWAVGNTFVDGTDSQTMILRWTGTKWVRQPSRNLDTVAPMSNTLAAVTAFGGSTVWAVGTFSGSPIRPAALRCC
ncbi:MAG TPA: hypothetical protein VK646_10145 [Actinomycetota bacterium]|nr:hypothetical protein [Actinomycetota bacterium]